MRLDKFMKVTQLIKRRTVANEVATVGFIKVNGKEAKPALILKVNDIIEIDMWNYNKVVKVLAIPLRGSIAKSDIEKYIELVEYNVKND